MAETVLEKEINEGLIDEGQVSFQAEGRLLQELGERLVASPEVALVELIKNSYDADSASCQVTLSENGKSLSIADKGHGMTFAEFVGKWMRIATASKLEKRFSPKYKRRLTGAKGIGRFAVRYLGDHLTLISIANDPIRKVKTKLTAIFNWPEIDRLNDIRNAEVDYRLVQVDGDAETGTTLEIRNLKTSTDFTGEKSLRTSVLRIVTPLQGLEAGRFKGATQGSGADPGFRVVLPGDDQGSAGLDLAKLVLSHYWARLLVELTGKKLTFTVWFSTSKQPKTLELRVNTLISGGFLADIRYFPRRKGVFQGREINGRAAWEWVRQNHGVAVVDHGFRIVPYGYEFDDWLHLAIDKAHSERNWRSKIAQEQFPIPESIRNRPALNPALNLPYSYQLVGAVFVESQAPGISQTTRDLVPSMDREGFLKNDAFDQLTDFVRAGVEFLAYQDKRELDRINARQAREASQSLKQDFQKAITYVKQSPTLTGPDKARIVKAYSHLATRIEEVEEYNVKARQSLMTMSLLGVVAGFMTHENKSLVHEMDQAVKIVQTLSRKHPALVNPASELARRLRTFKEQLQYAQMFIEGVRDGAAVRMSAVGQIRHILKRFESFAVDHGIEVSYEAAADVQTPALSPPVYTGVLLNLYTNALKAVLAVSSSIKHPKIAIRAWNERGTHSLEVCDTGVGIPQGLEKRIWDPLYTTTSDTGNPLGSGMGLGLTLIKQVVEEAGGKIKLVPEPPPGFTTCFRVDFPLEVKNVN